jgi:AraC-like DNA-binding protein
MRATNWSEPTDSLSAAKRAAGRRHYNAVRQFCAEHRRLAVSKLLIRIGWRRGCQTEIARKLGVSRSTICRDLQTLLRDSRAAAERAATFDAYLRTYRIKRAAASRRR